MLELSLQFASDEKVENSPISARLFRPDSGESTPPHPFTPPMDDPELKEIRWYLEDFSLWPTGPDYERAAVTEKKLEEWGRALHTAVIAESDASRMWQRFLDTPESEKVITIDATDPRVLRLPWELLADVSGPLFSQRISIRRRLQHAALPPLQREFKLPVRILVVVARPEDAGLIDSRAVTRPMLDAVDALGDKVTTEFLFPPTLRALSERLEDENAPPVHVVHFDGHGVYDSKQGLGYLLFENDDHTSDPVDANRLGTLLNNCGVPLMVLNACQSAAQAESNPYASVAARLIRAGVRNVLAMNYSVLVVAARKFVDAFYTALANGSSIGRSVDSARRRLLAEPDRHTITRRNAEGNLKQETTHLRDWFLPALYQQSSDVKVFPYTGDELPAPRALPRALTEPNSSGGLPAVPRYGFHGRARELLKLERDLFDHPVVVVHGGGGMGKTTLSAEAGRWFHRTGRFPGGAAFVSFEHGGGLATLCSFIGQAVSGDPNFALGEGDPVARIGELLRQKPALIILDNFESVLGSAPLMPADELKVVLDAVWSWAQTGMSKRKLGVWGARILITTRDTHFTDARFQPSKLCAHLPISGLNGEDALDLARELMEAHGIEPSRAPLEPLLELIDHLGGHPLSLNLVLPHLKAHTPQQLINDFEALLPGFKEGQAKERNESLAVSLEFSLKRLGQATRDALPALAVFEGGALEPELLAITEIDPDVWTTARAELEAAALVTVENLPGIIPPFLRFHPTLIPYLARVLPPERRAALEARYWQRYYALARYLVQADTQTPHQARAIAVREMPNLKRGFELALAAHQRGEADASAETVAGFADSIGRFLDVFGRRRESEAMLARLEGITTGTGGGLTRARFLHKSQQGDALLAQGHAAAAEAVFRDLLREIDQGMSYAGIAAEYDRAATLARLGRALNGQGKPAQALDPLRQALAIFQRLSVEDKDAKEMTAAVQTDLGVNLRSLGRFDEAKQAYETGLAISREINDQRGIGVKLGQLGKLAFARKQYAEARKAYQDALQTFRGMGEPASEAIIWHLLGSVALGEGDWDEAERFYRESLRLEEQLNNLSRIAQISNQLAIVCQLAGRLTEAEQWYKRAAEGYEQIKDWRGLSADLNNLANLYLKQNHLDEARAAAERAADLLQGLDLSEEPWKTYSILAEIAHKQGRADEAKAWRRKEVQARDAFDGTMYELVDMLQQNNPLITDSAAVAQGDARTRAALEAAFPQLEANGWRIAAPIRRIWDGERDPAALTDEIDYNSRAIVLAVLHRLGVPVPPLVARVDDQVRAGESAEAREVVKEFEDVIEAAVDGANGIAEAREALEELFPQLTENGWQIADPIRRIWAGERDAAALTAGIDGNSAAIVRAILDRLAGAAAPSAPAPAPSSEAAAQAEIRTLITHFQDLIRAAVDGAKGITAARDALEGAFPRMAQDGWQIAAPIRRIWAGERDLNTLVAGLDGQDIVLVLAVLHRLGVPVPPEIAQIDDQARGQTPPPAPSAPAPTPEPEQQGVTLDQLIEFVRQSQSKDAIPGMSAIVHTVTGQMAGDASLPAEVREMGRILQQIVSGDRQPDLSGLTPELSEKVRALLDALP